MDTTNRQPGTPAGRRHPWDIQRTVLFALLLREMKARVGGQWIGAVWTLFEPLAHVAIIVTILGVLRADMLPGIEYPVFLVTGLIPFFLWQHLATRLMDGIESNRGLFSYRQVKPLDTLLSRAAVESMMNLAVYVVSLLALAWIGYHVVPYQPLEMIGVNLLLVFFGTSFGILCAVLSHQRARLKSFVRMTMTPMYFASGVIIPIDRLPREYIEWLLWNPLLHLVELSRHAFIREYVPTDGVNVGYPAMFTLVVSAIGLALYRVNRLRLIAS